jgi:putative SbcD/Mre11-related phosphoesterase
MKPVFFQQIPEIPALYLKKNQMLVVADLHIGIENELREFGVHATSQIQTMKKRIFNVCEKNQISDIMMLGDVKHTIPSTPFNEKKELYNFLDELYTYGNLHIIPGNHDGGIKNLIPTHVKVHSSAGITIDDIGFIHGHRWPNEDIMDASFLLMGHTHPTVMLKDRLGFKTYEPCWLKCPTKKTILQERYPAAKNNLSVVIFPAFNQLCGGLAVNEEGIIGPMSSLLDIEQSEVFLLEGTNLGTINSLLF